MSRNHRGGPDTFRCKRCRLDVPMHAPGTRHRNHCPLCLWSRHLDVAGQMEPIGVTVQRDGEWSLVHRCGSCSHVRLNRIAGDDNPLALMQLAVKPLARPPFPLEMLTRAV